MYGVLGSTGPLAHGLVYMMIGRARTCVLAGIDPERTYVIKREPLQNWLCRSSTLFVVMRRVDGTGATKNQIVLLAQAIASFCSDRSSPESHIAYQDAATGAPARHGGRRVRGQT